MGGVLPFLGSAVGAVLSSSSAKSQADAAREAAAQQAAAQQAAAEKMAEAQKYATDIQHKQYEEARADVEPWRQAGIYALQQLLGMPAFNFDNEFFGGSAGIGYNPDTGHWEVHNTQSSESYDLHDYNRQKPNTISRPNAPHYSYPVKSNEISMYDKLKAGIPLKIPQSDKEKGIVISAYNPSEKASGPYSNSILQQMEDIQNQIKQLQAKQNEPVKIPEGLPQGSVNQAYQQNWANQKGNPPIRNTSDVLTDIMNYNINPDYLRNKGYGNFANWFTENKSKFTSPYLVSGQAKQIYDLATSSPLQELAKRQDIVGRGAYALALDMMRNAQGGGGNVPVYQPKPDYTNQINQLQEKYNALQEQLERAKEKDSLYNAYQHYLNSLGKPTGTLKQYISPSYKWRLEQGINALDKSAAARGMVLSGAQARALQRYGQDMASQEYENAFRRALITYNTNLGRWQSLAGRGQSAANTLAGLGSGYANALSDIAMSGANAQARYGIGAANSLAAGNMAAAQIQAQNQQGIAASINQALGNYMLMNMLNQGGGVSTPVSNNSLYDIAGGLFA